MKEKALKENSRLAIKYRGVECLNCGHPLDLTDRYCSYCGQLNTTKRLSLKDFASEFLLSVFTYDSRFRYTLKDLLFKPGTITRYYVNGERLKYANPFRFFLSVSIIYFIFTGLIESASGEQFKQNDNFNIFATDDENKDALSISDLENLEAITQAQLDSTEAAVVNQKIQAAFKKQKEHLPDSILKENKYKTQAELAEENIANRTISKLKDFYTFYDETGIRNPAIALDSLQLPPTRVNRWLYTKAEVIDRVQKNPWRFAEYMTQKIPFFLFFFAPVLALFFWLLYSRKKFNYMEHLVFIFHIFSFVFLVLLICYLPDQLLFGSNNDVFTGLAMTFIGPFYFYKALRNFYKQNRFITILKFVFLNFVFLVSSIFVALLFFAATAAFY